MKVHGLKLFLLPVGECSDAHVMIVGLAKLIEIQVNRSIYKIKTIIDMKI